MKTLLRISIIYLSLLVLPGHLPAAADKSLPVPPMTEIRAADITSLPPVSIDEKKRNHLDNFITGSKIGKKIIAQSSENHTGKRIKKKKSFFKNKPPLPPVELPSNWGGRIDEPPRETRKSKSKDGGHHPKNVVLPKRAPDEVKKRRLRANNQPVLDNAPVLDKEIRDKVSKEQSEARSRFNAFAPGSLVAIPMPILKDRSLEKEVLRKLDKARDRDKLKERETARGGPIAEHKKSGKDLSLPELKKGEAEVKKAALPVPPPVTVWPSADILSAQNACKTLLKNVDAKLKPIKPIRYGVCGTPAPLKVDAVSETAPDRVVINPPATLNCNFTARFAKWVKEKLQPLAEKHLKSPVRMVHNVSSYSCRHRYNDASKRISEHALVNALDIAGFTLKNGKSVSVLKHWDDEEELGAFLKEVHASACKDFVVVLGPEANEAHKNHFHFDLGRYPVCE